MRHGKKLTALIIYYVKYGRFGRNFKNVDINMNFRSCKIEKRKIHETESV